ncbi:carbohydrate ABC transporter permease [Candidatus Acetatifactor stercoripullorum]|uniref:carbohydrate ABC transporter permease n=1 Tax=Candidatus Acetatifactor stercoripullorum TaxID=2838414 RepID=UPI00298DA5C5|nr:carbohydrate ABC transporter permease [Candidatus Acetatifactor stercoripullorum]
MNSHRKNAKGFDIINAVLMVILSAMFLYPVIYIISLSFSDSSAIIEGRVLLFPVEFTTAAYERLFQDSSIINSFFFTVRITVFGVLSSLIATVIAAYPLSRSHLRGSGVIMRLIVFTMYFNGGIIPTYMVIRNLGLFNSMWSLILPNLVDTFLLIIMINYFRGLPVELEEAARADGCSNFKTFYRIFLPLAKPAVATLTVFYSVAYWNTFFNALLYIQDQTRLTLQVKLYQVLSMFSDALDPAAGVDASIIPENLKGATVVLAVLPIICVYPFMQRYFVKGVTVGAVKG